MGTGLSNPIIETDPASPNIAIGRINTRTSPTVPSGAPGPISPIGPTSPIVATGLTNLVAGTSPAVPSSVSGPIRQTRPTVQIGPSHPRGRRRNRSAEPFRRSVGVLTHRHRGPSRDGRLRPRAVSRGSSRSVSPRKKNHAPNPS